MKHKNLSFKLSKFLQIKTNIQTSYEWFSAVFPFSGVSPPLQLLSVSNSPSALLYCDVTPACCVLPKKRHVTGEVVAPPAVMF